MDTLRLIIFSAFLLLSLMTIARAPTNLLWYVSILITEFSWVFILCILLLLLLPFGSARMAAVSVVIAFAALGLLFVPYIQAFVVARSLQRELPAAFGAAPSKFTFPFQPLKIITGIGTRQVAFQPLVYDTVHKLSLDFYPAQTAGRRPCIVVIHGGSWAGGDSRQLSELNSEMAKWGYAVAGLNYRLAPAHRYPAPIEDVASAIAFLRSAAGRLSIDPSSFVLVGRSAGGQIALTAGYTLPDLQVKGVIDYYGPADMVWGYQNPTSPLVLDSRKIMEDFLGGTLQQLPHAYRSSSATETVSPNTPPTLMIYAENDPLVSARHGTRLTEKLERLRIPHYGLYLPWATHGFDYTLNGPGGQLSTWAVKCFLATVCKEE